MKKVMCTKNVYREKLVNGAERKGKGIGQPVGAAENRLTTSTVHINKAGYTAIQSRTVGQEQ